MALEEMAARWGGRSHLRLELLGQQRPGGPAIAGGFGVDGGRVI